MTSYLGINKKYKVPTCHIKFINCPITDNDGHFISKFILHQRWDTTEYIDGKWTVTSEYLPVEVDKNDL